VSGWRAAFIAGMAAWFVAGLVLTVLTAAAGLWAMAAGTGIQTVINGYLLGGTIVGIRR